jgi:hypothetical protein
MIFTPADKRGAGAFDARQRERDRKFADSPLEGTAFEPSVRRRDRNESRSGAGTVTEADKKFGLEAAAYLPDTESVSLHR